MLWQPRGLLYYAAQMAEMHARLHALPIEAFPAPAGPWLERWLGELEAEIRLGDLAGLSPGLDWLQRHRPADRGAPCILHLDFHP
jgi:aminoglycoside phosphotransferase (APT) family kinase protein